jgi:hypothetical protein
MPKTKQWQGLPCTNRDVRHANRALHQYPALLPGHLRHLTAVGPEAWSPTTAFIRPGLTIGIVSLERR